MESFCLLTYSDKCIKKCILINICVKMIECYYHPKNYYDYSIAEQALYLDYCIGVSHVFVPISIVANAIMQAHITYIETHNLSNALFYGVKEAATSASYFAMILVVPSLFSDDPVYGVEYAIDSTRYFYDTLVCEESPLLLQDIAHS